MDSKAVVKPAVVLLLISLLILVFWVLYPK